MSIRHIPLKNVHITDDFWSPRQRLMTDVTIPYMESILRDEVPGAEKSHAISNFRMAAGEETGEFYGMVFQDSDVAKWLEAAAYSLALKPDDALSRRVDETVALIGRCQQPDGYLNTYFTVKEPENRWKNLLECHELYCAGHLLEAGAALHEAAGKDELLRICVRLRKNVVGSGGTGSGKTTLLNVLSNYLPHDERILTIEDAAELRLAQPHLVRLEARPPNIEGRGAVTIRDLVRNALRMRPDRIIVGECRGGEALDMLQAMNTGHDGSLTTVHANSPRDVISRLETMVLMSGLELPSRAIREQIASAVDLIVHESRLSDGSRKVTCISEVMGMEGQQITLQDLFVFKQTGLDAKGRVLGRFEATGAIPSFYGELASRGLSLDIAVFSPPPAPPSAS